MRPKEISRSLELPEGYQTFNEEWFPNGKSLHGIHLNSTVGDLKKGLIPFSKEELYLYTQHLIFYDEGILKQTRSSPNWEGGLLTYCTCKHHMRTYRDLWEGVWIGGLCPSHCAENCLLFVGRVWKAFPSNRTISGVIETTYPEMYSLKRANTNPRGDLYSARRGVVSKGGDVHSHKSYYEPPNHTRSVEFYSKSPGSVSEREDGKIPKWWRDVEYFYNKRRPPCFIIDPCWLFSEPLAWSSKTPGRAALRMSVKEFSKSLTSGG